MTDLELAIARIAKEAAEAAAANAVERLESAILKRLDGLRHDDDLLTVREASTEFPYSFGAIQKQIQKAEINGLAEARAVVKHGHKWLIHRGRYREWLTRDGRQR